MGITKIEPLSKLAVRETLASFLFTACSLALMVFTYSNFLSGLRQTYTRVSIHLTLFIPLLLCYDLLHLSLNSTLNPALSLASHLTFPYQRQPLSHLLITILAQTLGHTLAVILLRLSPRFSNLLLPLVPSSTLSTVSATTIEALLTFSLAFAMLLSTNLRRTSAKLAFVVPVVVTLIGWGTDWTGPCMNPALAFALALGVGQWKWLEVYWMGPLLGAVGAAAVYRRLIGKGKDGRKVVRRSIVKAKKL